MSDPEIPVVDQAAVAEAEEIATELDELKKHIEDNTLHLTPKRLLGVIDRAIDFLKKGSPPTS